MTKYSENIYRAKIKKEIENLSYDKDIALINYLNWLDYTIDSTKDYCNTFVEIVNHEKIKEEILAKYILTCQYVKSLQKREKREFVTSKEFETEDRKINLLARILDCDEIIDKDLKKHSPFPKELHGYIHKNEFQPYHLMYKLHVNSDFCEGADVEFLIEYDITEPTVGIYYGVKYNSNRELSPKECSEINRKAYEEWDRRKFELCHLLNMVFVDKDFNKRVKRTNNASNHTYWPVWFSLFEDEDICNVGLNALKVVKHCYDREEVTIKKKIDKQISDRQRFTPQAYDKLATAMGKEQLDDFLRIVCEAGWFEKDRYFPDDFCAYCLVKDTDGNENPENYVLNLIVHGFLKKRGISLKLESDSNNGKSSNQNESKRREKSKKRGGGRKPKMNSMEGLKVNQLVCSILKGIQWNVFDETLCRQYPYTLMDEEEGDIIDSYTNFF